eukprot:gene12573-2295_t
MPPRKKSKPAPPKGGPGKKGKAAAGPQGKASVNAKTASTPGEAAGKRGARAAGKDKPLFEYPANYAVVSGPYTASLLCGVCLGVFQGPVGLSVHPPPSKLRIAY